MKSIFKKIISLPLDLQSDFTFDLSQREIAYLFGDGIINDSKLEGGWFAKALDKMADFISAFLQKTSPENRENWKVLRRHFLGCRAMLPVLKLATSHEKIMALNDQESLFLPGGWLGRPGHIFICIFKREKVTFSLTVVNTGDGIQFHQQVSDTYKRLYDPCLVISNIPEKNITKECVTHLLEFLISDSDRFNHTHLYGWVLPQFGGERRLNPTQKIQEDFMTHMRSGICFFKAIEATVRLFVPWDQYKAFKLYWRTEVLKLAVQTYQQNSSSNPRRLSLQNESTRNLMRYAAENFSRMVLKRFEEQSLTSSALSMYSHLARRILNDVETAEKKSRLAQQPLKSSEPYDYPLHQMYLPTVTPPAMFEPNKRVSCNAQGDSIDFSTIGNKPFHIQCFLFLHYLAADDNALPTPRLSLDNVPKNLIQSVFLGFLRKDPIEKNYVRLVTEIQRCLEFWPVPVHGNSAANRAFDEIPKAELIDCLFGVEKMLDMLCKNINKQDPPSHPIMSGLGVAVLHLYAIADKLARLEPELGDVMKRFRLPLTSFTQKNETLPSFLNSLTLSDPNQRERLNACLGYFKSQPATTILFQFDTLKKREYYSAHIASKDFIRVISEFKNAEELLDNADYQLFEGYLAKKGGRQYWDKLVERRGLLHLWGLYWGTDGLNWEFDCWFEDKRPRDALLHVQTVLVGLRNMSFMVERFLMQGFTSERAALSTPCFDQSLLVSQNNSTCINLALTFLIKKELGLDFSPSSVEFKQLTDTQDRTFFQENRVIVTKQSAGTGTLRRKDYNALATARSNPTLQARLSVDTVQNALHLLEEPPIFDYLRRCLFQVITDPNGPEGTITTSLALELKWNPSFAGTLFHFFAVAWKDLSDKKHADIQLPLAMLFTDCYSELSKVDGYQAQQAVLTDEITQFLLQEGLRYRKNETADSQIQQAEFAQKCCVAFICHMVNHQPINLGLLQKNQ